MRKTLFLCAIVALACSSGCSIVSGEDGRTHIHWHPFATVFGSVIDAIIPGKEATPTADLLIDDRCTESCKREEDKPLIDEPPYNAYKR